MSLRKAVKPFSAVVHDGNNRESMHHVKPGDFLCVYPDHVSFGNGRRSKHKRVALSCSEPASGYRIDPQ